MGPMKQAPAFLCLRASAKRVLQLIRSELARQGETATIYTDQLEMCGSIRVYRPAMAEISSLGFAEITRYPKKYVCRASDRWREVCTLQDARILSTLAREHCTDDRVRHAENVDDAAVA
jgi:hypothetical protein